MKLVIHVVINSMLQKSQKYIYYKMSWSEFRIEIEKNDRTS